MFKMKLSKTYQFIVALIEMASKAGVVLLLYCF